jgi:nucleotide-binding universal stress UspA family protein
MIGAIDPLVGPPLGEMAGVPASVDTRQDSDAERYLDRMARPFQQQQATVETRVLHAGGAGRSIVDVAHEVGADLIVVGTVGRSFLGRAFVGSVADKVVRRAECSVLVVPTKRRD